MSESDARLRRALERLLAHEWAPDCQECGIGHSEVWVEAQAVLAAPQPQKCPTCNGTGGGENRMGGPEWTCETCKGTGQAVLAAPAEPPQQDQLAEIRARHAGGREWNSQNLHWADQAERDRGKLLALVDSQVADLARLREANETLTQENARLRGLLLAGRSDEGH